MGADEVREWAETVLSQLEKVADLDGDRFTILAGQKYRRHLVPELSTVAVPMEGMRIGEQLQFLNGGGRWWGSCAGGSTGRCGTWPGTTYPTTSELHPN